MPMEILQTLYTHKNTEAQNKCTQTQQKAKQKHKKLKWIHFKQDKGQLHAYGCKFNNCKN